MRGIDFGDVIQTGSDNQFKIQMELSFAVNNRKIFINDDIDEESIFKYMYYINKILEYDKRVGSKNPIEICVNTNGGEVYSAFMFISFLENLKDLGYKIITTNVGKAFSAGFLISIVGSERRSYRYARYMYHQPSTFNRGKYQEIKEDLNEMEYIKNLGHELIMKYTDMKKDFLEDIDIKKQDKYLSPEDMLEYKGIERII